MRICFFHSLLVVLLAGLVTATSQAAAPANSSGAGQIEKRFGPAVVERLLASKEESERIRGMERLATIETPQTLEFVGRVLDSEMGKSARLRLVAVRALARRVAQPGARALLGRLMSSGDSAPGRGSELDAWVRFSAALALAASATPDSAQWLARALRHEGPVATAAAEALVAFPPSDLEPLLRARGSATITLVETLERLADQRSFGFLRRLIRSDSLAVRARAALALTRLGDFETVELARYWLAHERTPELRHAATWILALGHAEQAPAAIAYLLAQPATRAQGLELALAFPHPELARALEARLDDCGDDCNDMLTALGRAGAAGALAVRLGDPRLGRAAAYALALCPTRSAQDEVERALKNPALLPVVARAAVVRKVVLDQGVRGLKDTLEAMLAATDPDQRAAAAWGLGTLDSLRAQALLASPDPAIVRAAARALVGSNRTEQAADRWQREEDPVTRAALGVALLSSAGANRVSTRSLVTRLAEGDPLTPLLARALAERDCADLRPRVRALLQSGDPWVRAHTALGLARSNHPGALGLLDDAYRFETDVEVRRAVIQALSQRSETSRERTLRLARDLDADRGVRSAAKLALLGQKLPVRDAGLGTLWLDVSSSAAQGHKLPALVLVSVSAATAVPGVTDPGSLVVISGLPRGLVNVRVAALVP